MTKHSERQLRVIDHDQDGSMEAEEARGLLLMSGLLRICTAGSVDDGKSTLIGRLLYDSRSVYEDQVSSVEKASKNRTAGPIDFSLFTDGLKAEREQGITIDVAYRYFATARRKFILADTPGHEQYTRNMATGASTADVAILLVDARNGVRIQTRRHARIAQLLGITEFVLAINKMDLVDFDRQVFDDIVDDFEEILPNARNPSDSDLGAERRQRHHEERPHAVVRRHRACSSIWRRSRSITRSIAKPFRLPVQLVARPDQDFRGYAGQILAGIDSRRRPGHGVAVGPHRPRQAHRHLGRRSRDGARADVGDAVARRRDRHQPRGHDHGSGLGSQARGAQRRSLMSGQRFEADVVWMDERPLDPARLYC